MEQTDSTVQTAPAEVSTKEKKSERKSDFPSVTVLRLMTQVEVCTAHCNLSSPYSHSLSSFTHTLLLPLSLSCSLYVFIYLSNSQQYKAELRQYLVSLRVNLHTLF